MRDVTAPVATVTWANALVRESINTVPVTVAARPVPVCTLRLRDAGKNSQLVSTVLSTTPSCRSLSLSTQACEAAITRRMYKPGWVPPGAPLSLGWRTARKHPLLPLNPGPCPRCTMSLHCYPPCRVGSRCLQPRAGRQHQCRPPDTAGCRVTVGRHRHLGEG